MQEVPAMHIDFRVVVVLLPLLLAAGWAGFNIFKAALGQIQGFLNSDKV
jgi:photosystem II PsbY protein